MFNSKGDNLKILTFKRKVICQPLWHCFQDLLTVYVCIHNEVLFEHKIRSMRIRKLE